MSEAKTPPPRAGEGGEGGKLIRGAIVAFVATGALLFFLGGRLAPETTPEPRFAIDEKAHPAPPEAGEGPGTFQVTLDTADAKHFVPFDLAAGAIRPVEAGALAQESDGTGLPDIVARRYGLRAPHGAWKLGKVPLSEARVPANPPWQRDRKSGGEFQNPAMQGWYKYSYWTHLLRSNGEVYAVRLTGGGVAYVKVVSYYCQPEGSGCLTLRYRLDLETSAAGR